MKKRIPDISAVFESPLFFIAPLCFFIAVCLFFPLGTLLVQSATEKITGAFPVTENYRSLVTHFMFPRAFMNTVLIAAISLALQGSLGLALALFLHHTRVAPRFLFALLLVPLGVPTIVNGAVMRYIFDLHGFLNEALLRLGVIAQPVDWLDGSLVSLGVLVAADLWKVLPFVVLILVAGRKTIDRQLYEAAAIDGASAWQQFRYITMPCIKPFLVLALILRGIDVFRLFELPLALFGSSFPILSTYAYFEFSRYNNPYRAAAASWILIVSIGVFVIAYFWYDRVRRREGGAA